MCARPNILLITSDQQHYDTIGAYNPRIKTPALDRLVHEGTRFTRAYCNNPVCSPSRSTIITGQYPSWHGCWSIGVKLPEDVPTVGDLFLKNGYATTLVGKAHFQPLASDPDGPGGASIECHPTLRDLDFWRHFPAPGQTWYGFEQVETSRMHGDENLVGGDYAIWMEEQGLHNWRDYFRALPHDPDAPQREHRWDLPEQYHYSTWTAQRTIANIERHVQDDCPFFMWSSFHDPHPPYLVPEPWASMYDPEDMCPGTLQPGELDRMPLAHRMTQDPHADWSIFDESDFSNHGYNNHLTTDQAIRKNIATYYGMVSFMDQQIGRILDKLDALGIADNTIVIFTTDHGHFLGQHGLTAKGAFHYEDLLRLPFLVRYPKHVPSGRDCQALQGLIDLAPTCLDACGIQCPGVMQGVSQLDVWLGKTSQARDHVLTEFRHQPTKVHLRTYIDARYKMTVYRNQDDGELFDLQEDPHECRNLWNDPEAQALKTSVLHKFINAEMQREPTRMPRIANA